jgi:hypothetical protein
LSAGYAGQPVESMWPSIYAARRRLCPPLRGTAFSRPLADPSL